MVSEVGFLRGVTRGAAMVSEVGFLRGVLLGRGLVADRGVWTLDPNGVNRGPSTLGASSPGF